MKTQGLETRDLDNLSIVLDSKFKLPLGLKIGWDGILGLIPGVGDIFTSILSFYILFRAALLGCSASVLLRMGMNVFIDNLIAMIPVLGNIGDFFWKSNTKNVRLLHRHLQDPGRTAKTSAWLVASVLLGFFAVTMFMIGLGVYVLVRLFQWLL